MSRIGRKTIKIPSGVTVKIEEGTYMVSGSKGTLSVKAQNHVLVNVENDVITVTRENDQKNVRAAHGSVRSLLANCVKGVTEGFKKDLELVGVGYRAAMDGKKLKMSLGFSHPVIVTPVEGVSFTVVDQTKISVSGFDKGLVGEMAAEIRKARPPEPYKGKGIRYAGEVVRRKAGKTGKAE